MVRIAPSTNRRLRYLLDRAMCASTRTRSSIRSHNACFSISLCKRYYRLRGIPLPCYSLDPNFVGAATKSPKTRKGIVAPKETIKRFVATRRDPHKVRRLPAFESDAWGQCDRVPSETEDFSTDFQAFYVPRRFSLSPVAEHRLSGRLFRYIWQTFEARYAILAHFAGRTYTPTKQLCRSTAHGAYIQLLSVSFSFFHLSLSFENGPFFRPSIAI